MTVLVFKLRSKRIGPHVHTTVFSGVEGQTLANTGTLVQTVGEWQVFGALLVMGARRMYPRVKIIFEGDEEVVGNG